MKKIFLISAAVVFILSMSSCSIFKKAPKKEEHACTHNHENCPNHFSLANKIDTISYIIGADIAGNLSANGIEINIDKFVQGIKNKINNVDTLFTQQEIQKILTDFQEELQKKQQEKTMQESSGNKTKGNEFLAANKTKPGVKVTSSGLQYKVIKEGTGEKPSATSKVTVNYEGKLIDGTIFDSSFERGEPISFGLNQVIPGWTEGLQLMTTGSTYELYIPSDLGYGDRSIPSIPAGSVLIFKVELISFE